MKPQSTHGSKQLLLVGTATVSALASALSAFLYYSLYWQHRSRFDEHGRYFDEVNSVVHHSQSSVLLLPALAFLLLALCCAGLWRARRRAAAVRAADGS